MAHSCYIHLPFCRSLCSYCDFYRVLHDSELEQAYVRSLKSELELRLAGPDHLALRTLYFGGGTPSALSPDSWRQLFIHLAYHFGFSSECEITVEANPESASVEKLALLSELGVNRLSLGAQSFQSDYLDILGRRHSVEQIAEAVSTAGRVGIENVSLDLIYGLPDETESDIVESLSAAVSLQPQHISLYALTLENNVPLQQQVEAGEIALPDDDQTAEHYLAAVRFLASHAYQQYEVSNFAKSGHECRHNLNYWRRGDYLGFGPAAVSTIGSERVKNLPDLNRYIGCLRQRLLPPHEVETLDRRAQLTETIMLSLRLSSGLDLAGLRREFGIDPLADKCDLISELREAGDLLVADERLALTPQGMLRLNAISEALLPEP